MSRESATRPPGQPEWQTNIAKRVCLESAYRPVGWVSVRRVRPRFFWSKPERRVPYWGDLCNSTKGVGTSVGEDRDHEGSTLPAGLS